MGFYQWQDCNIEKCNEFREDYYKIEHANDDL